MSPLITKALLIVLPVVLYFQVMKPMYTGIGSLYSPEKSIPELRMLDDQYDATIVQAQQLVSQADDLKNQYANLSDDTKMKLKVMIPEKIDQVRLVDEVNAIIEKSGFTSIDISSTEVTNLGKGKSGYAVSFSTKGTYPKFKELVTNLQKSLRLYTISSVNFSIPQIPTDLTSFQIRLETYYLK